jgi:hypothetical protein
LGISLAFALELKKTRKPLLELAGLLKYIKKYSPHRKEKPHFTRRYKDQLVNGV